MLLGFRVKKKTGLVTDVINSEWGKKKKTTLRVSKDKASVLNFKYILKIQY